MNEKTCSTCKIVKIVSEFEEDERYVSGYRSQCNQCRYDRQFTKRLDNFLRNRYDVTLEWFENKLKAQGNRCAICGQEEARRARPNATVTPKKVFTRLSVDHNHETNKLRGLLCHTCNIGLGHFQDDPQLLKKAAEYLEEYR